MSKVRGGQVFVEIGADPKKFFAALTKLNGQIGKLGASMQNVGAKMTAIGVGLGVPIGLAVRQFAAFDDAIRATAAVSQASGRELQMLNDKARELGATTSFTAIQVANLMTELGRAGFKPDEINAMTGAVLDLARATGTDAALSAGIMAATLRQFGLGATEAARAADVLTKAANSTFNTVEGLGESLKYAGPVAKSLGLSLEDTTAILGVLGNVGIQGSEAGTALRRLSVISAASGDKLKELFGVTNTDAAGNLKPLVQILDEINTATASMPVAERTKRMAEAFGLLGITSANVLSSTAGGVRGLADELRNAEGTAAKAAKEMDAGLGGAFRIAISAIEGTALALGDALAPSLIAALNGVIDVATGLTTFVKANQDLILSVAKGIALFTAVGGTLIGLGATLKLVSFSMGGLLSTFSGVAAVAGFLLSPIGLLVVALAALQAFGPKIAASMQGMFGGVGAMVESASSAIGSGFNAAVSNGMIVLGDLASTATVTFDGIYAAIAEGDLAGAMDVLWAGLYAGWLRGVEAIMGAVDPWVSMFQNAFTILGAELYKTWDSMWTGVGSVMNTAGAYLMGAMDNIINPLLAAWDALEAGIRKSWNRVQSLFKTGFNLKAENDKVDSEMEARKRQRELDRPGIEGRTARAGRENAQAEKDLRDRQKAIDDNTQATIDGREAENQRRADERRANTQAAEDNVGRKSKAKQGVHEERRRDAEIAAQLLKALGSASSLEEITNIGSSIGALIDRDNLDAAAEQKLLDAYNQAFARVNATATTPAGAKIAGGAGAAGADAATSKAEVAGTFSSVNLAGMGFGSTIAERQLKALETIADNTSNLEGPAYAQE